MICVVINSLAVGKPLELKTALKNATDCDCKVVYTDVLQISNSVSSKTVYSVEL